MSARKTYRVCIENVDLGSNDDGPFRSLELQCYGDTYDECWENAHVVECDQDGGEVRDYPAADLGGRRADLVDQIIREALFAALGAPTCCDYACRGPCRSNGARGEDVV